MVISNISIRYRSDITTADVETVAVMSVATGATPTMGSATRGTAPAARLGDEIDAQPTSPSIDDEFDTSLGITVSIRQLIGAGIILGLGIVILNQVFSMDMVSNSSGPFEIATVTDPLGAALGIMGLALFVGGARVIMNQMGGTGGRGGL